MMLIRAPSENLLNEWYNWLVNADKNVTKLYNWIFSHIPHVIIKDIKNKLKKQLMLPKIVEEADISTKVSGIIKDIRNLFWFGKKDYYE